MTNPNQTRDPMTLHPGDVITRHPDRPETGEWTVIERPATDGFNVLIEYSMSGGATGIFVVPADLQITVRKAGA